MFLLMLLLLIWFLWLVSLFVGCVLRLILKGLVCFRWVYLYGFIGMGWWWLLILCVLKWWSCSWWRWFLWVLRKMCLLSVNCIWLMVVRFCLNLLLLVLMYDISVMLWKISGLVLWLKSLICMILICLLLLFCWFVVLVSNEFGWCVMWYVCVWFFLFCFWSFIMSVICFDMNMVLVVIDL